MPPRKKETGLPPLSRIAVKPPEPEKPAIPEEPKFYGAEFAILINTWRKMGTLRERAAKRAGLTRGLRIMSHVHEDAKSPSMADIELVILDVYHGKLAEVYQTHKLAFMLDGILSETEAIDILQRFYPTKVTRQTEIDYFTFIPAPRFDQLSPENQERLLSLPLELALSYPDLARVYYPSFCQALAWHNAGLSAWLDFLIKIKTITPEEAEAIANFPTPNTGAESRAIDMDKEPDYGLQFLLNEFNLKDPLYYLAVMADLATARALTDQA